jgi:hypothetical protein
MTLSMGPLGMAHVELRASAPVLKEAHEKLVEFEAAFDRLLPEAPDKIRGKSELKQLILRRGHHPALPGSSLRAVLGRSEIPSSERLGFSHLTPSFWILYFH